MSNDIQPEIRFPGFTEDWEERKLGTLLKYEQPTKYIVKSTDYNEGFEIPVLTAGKSFILGYTNEVDGIKNASKDSPIIIFDDFTTSSHYVDFPFKVKSSAMKLLDLTTDSLDFYFIFNILKNIKYVPQSHERHWIAKFSEFKVLVPSYDEQQKIGTFFQQLDDTIALHQRKLDLLKETKKGFLQKMFPKNGAKVPEIRFPGFTGDWEERKLGEVVVFLNGRAFKQQELLDSGKYRVLRVGNFNTNDRWYYSNLELEEDKYANKGDLLYLWATSFGPEMWNEERVIYHYHIWKLKFLSKELDKQYLYTWLLTDKEKIKESTNGTTMVHVTKGGIEQRTFQFPPDINEQQKIGAFFKQLDDTIALHQRKLDLLKETKKGFLQKMFV